MINLCMNIPEKTNLQETQLLIKINLKRFVK